MASDRIAVADRHLGEFERIARFFAPLAGPGALGLRDDAALIDGPPGRQLVLTVDAIVAGIDYLPDDPPDLVARKLLRVNLSDLAAKGATPLGYLLTTVLPAECGETWLAGFSAGLAADQAEFAIVLLGGDSSGTPGAATLSTSPARSATRRSACVPCAAISPGSTRAPAPSSPTAIICRGRASPSGKDSAASPMPWS